MTARSTHFLHWRHESCPSAQHPGSGAAAPTACRLLSRAQSVHNRVYREAFGCGRKGSNRQTGLLLDRVQEVIDTLTEYRCVVECSSQYRPAPQSTCRGMSHYTAWSDMAVVVRQLGAMLWAAVNTKFSRVGKGANCHQLAVLAALLVWDYHPGGVTTCQSQCRCIQSATVAKTTSWFTCWTAGSI